MEEVKNSVSYFRAGFMAGLVESGKFTKKEVENLFYKTMKYPNKMIKAFSDYDNKK